jgi:hypothetical protein
MGDDLLQVTGRGQLTVLTGPHTGPVEVRSRVLPSAPDGDLDGWHGAAECITTVSDRQSLIRVRVLVRNRRLEDQPSDPLAPEQYEVAMWPVDEDAGFRSLRVDDVPSSMRSSMFARAAGWAMPRLVASVIPNPREAALRRAGLIAADPPIDRVRVWRLRTMPAAWARAFLLRPADHLGVTVDGAELALPTGDVEVRLRQIATQEGFAARWRWAARPGSASAVIDPTESTVHIGFRGDGGEIADLTMLHEGVPAPKAILLGFASRQRSAGDRRGRRAPRRDRARRIAHVAGGGPLSARHRLPHGVGDRPHRGRAAAGSVRGIRLLRRRPAVAKTCAQ